MAPHPPATTQAWLRPDPGFLSTCPKRYDYLLKLRQRQTRWLNSSHAVRRGLWQRAIDDKLLGYIFARSVGVLTPSVLFCDTGGVQTLPQTWPRSWGCCFVIKPLYGYNDIGVFIVENGVDRFTGQRLVGRADLQRLIRDKHGTLRRLGPRTIYVETLIRPELSLYTKNATPTDFKFLSFGGTIGTVGIIEGRATDNACMAFVDERFQRTDTYGCVCSRTAIATGGCSYRHCPLGYPLRPQGWDAMVRAAHRLGQLVGVHMRIDLYASKFGVPMLGEFTPWHTNGKMHCDLRPPEASAVQLYRNQNTIADLVRSRRDAVTNKRTTVDVCRLGRLWESRGREEGGPFDPKPPPVLRNWRQLMYNEKAKCAMAVEKLRPPQWDRAGHGGGR